jgi:phosphoribosylformylglycinamidine cyclo-ligase
MVGALRRSSYKGAGVDIEKVHEIQRATAGVLSSTFATRKGRVGEPLIPIGHYAGLIDIGGGRALALHVDGVGSKLLVAQMMHKFDTVGIDCVAMTVNDLICLGCEPVSLVDYLALEREDEPLVQELAKGLAAGARAASVAIVGGETAILGEMVKGVEGTGFDLAAMGVGIVEKVKVLDGSALEVGDVVVGVASSGLHSNGFTLARKVLLGRHSLTESLPELGGRLGEALLAPTAIYVKPALRSLAEFEVHAIGHVTGGAFSKLTRLVGKRRLGFVLDRPPSGPIFEMIQREGRLSYREMCRTFNMGIGLCLCVPRSEADGVIRVFERHSFEALVLGRVVSETGVRVGGTNVSPGPYR